MNPEKKDQSGEKEKWKNIPVYLVSEDEDNRLNIKIPVTFGLLMKSNISTGFSWGLRGNDKNEVISFLEIVDYDPGVNEKKRFGSDEYEMFVFKTLKSGESHLEFVFARPWEKDKKPEKKIKVKITVISKE